MGERLGGDAIAGAFEELPTSIFLLSSLRWLTLQKKNIQQIRKLGSTCSLGIMDDGIAGAFEELPTLLVVLVAISLFSVSVAHAAASWGESDEITQLQQNCFIFSDMVRNSETLCMEGKTGVYDYGALQNFSSEEFFDEFNVTEMGFEYRISIQCLSQDNGNITLGLQIQTSELNMTRQTACTHTCVNIDKNGRMLAARVTVTIW